MSWFRMESEAWPELLEQLPRPLSRWAAIHDLRWLFYESPSRGRVWSHSRLAERWGWLSAAGKPSKKRVRLLIASEDWQDPHHQKGTVGAQQGHSRGTAGAQQGHKENGQTSPASEVGAQQGHTEGTVGAHEGHAEGYTRVDPPSPSPLPLPSLHEEQTSEQAPSVPAPDWRLSAFNDCAAFLNAGRVEQKRKRHTYDRKGKAGTEGGELWRMLKVKGQIQDVVAVLRFLRLSDHERAEYYREKRFGMVAVRRHFKELHGLALEYKEEHGGFKPRSAHARRGPDAYGEVETDTAEAAAKLRAWVAEKQANA